MNILQGKIGTKACKVTVLLAFVFTCLLLLIPAKAFAASETAIIPVEQIVGAGSATNSFDYVLTPVDSANPMPAGTTGGFYTFSMTGNQSTNVYIEITHAGMFRYELRGDPATTYDTTVYGILIVARNMAAGGLQVEVHAYFIEDIDDPLEDKSGDAVFDQSQEPGGFGPTDPSLMVDPPVVKTVQGNPAQQYTFTFRLVAQDPANPMPAGSIDGVKEITITGSGSAEFGVWSYTEPGVFIYEVREVNTGNPDYRFDSTVYTITDTVTEPTDATGDRRLVLSRVVTNSDNRQVTSMSFINTYIGETVDIDPPPPPPPPPGGGTTPRPPSEGPKTGDYADPVQLLIIMVASAIIALFILYLIYLDRRSERDHGATSPAI